MKELLGVGWGGRDERMVVMEGNEGKDEVVGEWVRGGDKRLGRGGGLERVDG